MHSKAEINEWYESVVALNKRIGKQDFFSSVYSGGTLPPYLRQTGVAKESQPSLLRGCMIKSVIRLS